MKSREIVEDWVEVFKNEGSDLITSFYIEYASNNIMSLNGDENR